MRRLHQDRMRFKNFNGARYATDVTLQHSLRSSGSIEEGKLYFSGKYKLYGYKIEVSVLPNGLTLGFSGHFQGSVADLQILQRNRFWHEKELKTTTDEKPWEDTELLADKYPRAWGLIVDKEYQGCAEFMRGISPIKEPPRGSFTISQESFHRKVSSDRIIVKNFFDRLCGL